MKSIDGWVELELYDVPLVKPFDEYKFTENIC